MDRRRCCNVYCQRANPNFVCSGCHAQFYCGKTCGSVCWSLQGHEEEHAAEPPTELIKGLWVGGISAVTDAKFIARVDVVISVLGPKKYSKCKMKNHRLKGKRVIRIDLEDEPDAPIERYFAFVSEQISLALFSGQTVLLHCGRGVSRSVALALFYLCKFEAKRFPTIADALLHVMKLRRTARPLPEFIIKAEQMLV